LVKGSFLNTHKRKILLETQVRAYATNDKTDGDSIVPEIKGEVKQIDMNVKNVAEVIQEIINNVCAAEAFREFLS
jgi:hypothetical protein